MAKKDAGKTITVQQQIIDKKAKFYTIDAVRLAKEVGLGARINTIMQTAFFVISGVLEKDEAIQLIKDAIVKSYGKRGQKIIDMNFRAVDTTVANLKQLNNLNSDYVQAGQRLRVK